MRPAVGRAAYNSHGLSHLLEEQPLSDATPIPSVPYAHPGTSTPESLEPRYYGLTVTAWLKIGIITLLMGAMFWPSFRLLWDKTNPIYGEPNWGHAICVPIIGIYFLYLHRDELLKAKAGTAWSGLIFLLGGILIFIYGIWPGQNDFIKHFGMVVTLFGVVLTLAGWSVMKIAWFPIAFLICAIPWPGLVYSWVAGPLQQLAARVAVKTLQLTGVAAARAGTKIIMEGEGGEVRTLNVAEACAGMRSLMTFISVGAAIAFLSSRPFWQKIIIVLSAIPIAIFCNVLRVTGQGILDFYVSKQLSEDFAHQFVGLVMLVPAFFLLLLVCWILDHLFIEEADSKDGVKAKKELVVEVPRRQPAVALGGATAGAVAAKTATPAMSAPRPPIAPARPAAAAPPPRPATAPPRPTTMPPRPATAIPRPTAQLPPRPGIAKNAPQAGTKPPPQSPRRVSDPGGAIPQQQRPPKKEGQ